MNHEDHRITRRSMIGGLGGLALGGVAAQTTILAAGSPGMEPIRGIYVHRAWPYRRPYAARAWTLADWRGFAEGLGELGFNTVVVWPVIEIMPLPPTPSDTADLELLAGVIEMLHEMRMKVFTTLCPNIVADDAAAPQPDELAVRRSAVGLPDQAGDQRAAAPPRTQDVEDFNVWRHGCGPVLR